MNIQYYTDYHEMSKQAHDLIIKSLQQKPDLLLCAATGNSPLKTYQLLTESYHKSPTSFTKLRLLKLDEWGGVDPQDPQTCESFLQKHLLKPLNIRTERYFGFRSDADDPQAECDRIEAIIKDQGSIDLCVLGLGRNGHIAFNEPADSLQPHCHIAKLSSDSMQHTMAKAMQQQPTYGLTLGMADIFQAKQILLLITGSNKKQVVEQLLKREISSQLPASLLWLHPSAICLIDNQVLG